MKVKSLAGTDARYIVAQVRTDGNAGLHFQIRSEGYNSHANRDYGFAFDAKSIGLNQALRHMNGPMTISLVTDKNYHFCQVRPKYGHLHVQILDGSVNRGYGGAWDLPLGDELRMFLTEELSKEQPAPSPELKYAATVEVSI